MKIPDISDRSVPDDAVEAMSSTIGEMFLNFAFIDQALDYLLIELFPFAVKRNIASKMPFQLGQKIDFLTKCFDRMRELAPLQADAGSVFKEINDYAWVRNTLAHGALSHYIDKPQSSFVFVKLSYSKANGVHLADDVVLNFNALSQATRLARGAVPKLHALLKKIQALGLA
ncbi:hypothetical protein LJR235_002905 [Pararhizobium sp. LjRoot235]|uniref:hypothetical protein n=1 Tax=Pararhizobium sp. LjRoot235 TaxID=3342291 RepID=UPI003ECDF1E0